MEFFGLGLNPGRTCIIYTFRLKRVVTKQKRLERLKKVDLNWPHYRFGALRIF